MDGEHGLFLFHLSTVISPSNIYSPTVLSGRFKHTQSMRRVLARWCYRAERKGSAHGASCLGFQCCAPVRPRALAARQHEPHLLIWTGDPRPAPPRPPAATTTPPQPNTWAGRSISHRAATESTGEGGAKGLGYNTERAQVSTYIPACMTEIEFQVQPPLWPATK